MRQEFSPRSAVWPQPSMFEGLIERIAPAPWSASVGAATRPRAPRPLYTPEERVRRDRSPWTIVQGVLAPLQFLVFLASLTLVLRYLTQGTGHDAASWSIIVKTGVLYTIMITGAIWEKEVFGKWLFAPAFFWEDVFSQERKKAGRHFLPAGGYEHARHYREAYHQSGISRRIL